MEQLIAPTELLVSSEKLKPNAETTDELIKEMMLIEIPDIRLENLVFYFAVDRKHLETNYVEFNFHDKDFKSSYRTSVPLGIRARFGESDWDTEDENLIGFIHSERKGDIRFGLHFKVRYMGISCKSECSLDKISVEIGWRYTYQIFSRFSTFETYFPNGELNHQFGDTFPIDNQTEAVVMEIDYDNRIVYCGAIQGLK